MLATARARYVYQKDGGSSVKIRIHADSCGLMRIHADPKMKIRIHADPKMKIRIHADPKMKIRIHADDQYFGLGTGGGAFIKRFELEMRLLVC